MSITIEDVKKLAKLSRLEFTDEEALQFVDELTATLAQVDAINKVDVSQVDLFEKTVNADTELRADEIKPSLPVEQIVANAPDKKDGAFLVPITVAED
ncbi:MAG: Asp-tRNA(Asn)/Glu-tRNA(Gln) amidotransferase subunit GatC [Clostridia bacterium]|nr:Asp-tRNA(Asn)/Glu-tRNA(Gln) amidotransferase subunit GatC [Clostridia bacterium]